MKLIFFILILFTPTLKSQIRIDYTIKKIEGTNKHILDISFVNNTKIKYMLPIDTTGFRVYYPEEPCSNFYYESSADKGLGLMLLFKYNEEYVMGDSRNHHLREIDLDVVKPSKIDQTFLNKWKKKWGFKDDLSAKKNMYLFQSLISLKPTKVYHLEKK